MKANNTPANLKGMAKHTYNRVMSAMAEDSDPAMLHTFAALTDSAKAIALQSGNFSNLYIRGINKCMTAEEAANELTERAAAIVSRKLRKIDMVCAAAFLAEYISRQRKEAEQPEPTNPDNTPSTMNANEITAPEFSELSHAGQCLDIYLHNTREIYDRYTVPAIRKVAAMMRSNATHPQQFDVSPAGVSGLWEVIRAISAAAGLVRKYDELAPTQDDKNQVIRNYAAYIVDCAKHEIENA